ncbi:hypothetical protein MF672_000695 [Actinomadura sp. ATCC 31491]|uniref:NACHT domain-containing protein n=1 Tax=Actinomadura luzonensis TaxID=2805427 RepID=A0ABT0FJ42_9ACTN|nr:hypothetical protein [Actinomadura luzonensis]MCK2212322.1 hypothetical protein [Actinomadura luzonensis]
MRFRRSTIGAILVVLVLIMIATVVVAWVYTGNGTIKPQEMWTGVIPVFVGVLAAVLPWLMQVRDRPPPSLEEAARQRVPALRAGVARQWEEERTFRGLYAGERAELRWRAAPGSDPHARLAATVRDEGTLDALAGAFAAHARAGEPTRLVVTGDLGAGKTSACVLLTLELGDDVPLVPVLFQLASWRPAVPLYEWMAEELLTAYPVVDDERHGRRVAAHLARHHVLPVLDGLDELSGQTAALARVEEETEGRSFVLSCRSAEFEAVNAGRVLRRVLVVRLQPVPAADARAYLLERGDDRLEPLVAKLAAHPDGPVAEALSTPLMLSLAVARGGEPVPPELLEATGPDAADRIRRHLLGALVAKAFAPRPDDTRPPVGGEKARRYLEFLATQVDGAGRLAWWRLQRAVPRPVFVVTAFVIATVSCAALAAAYFSVFGRPWLGFWIGASAGGLGSFIVSLLPQDDPSRARPAFRSAARATTFALARTLGFGLTGGAACAVIVWFLYDSPFYVVVGGALSGLTFAMARYVSTPTDPLEAVTPRSLLASDRAAVLAAWVAGGVPGALTGAYLGGALKDGHRPELAALPVMSLPPAVLALLGAIAGCGLSAAGLGLMAHGSSAWGQFITTRVWLAARGLAPLRLMTFLQEARERGVLRQYSGFYEFRHRLLQYHLARPVLPGTAAAPEPAPAGDPATATSAGPDNVQ